MKVAFLPLFLMALVTVVAEVPMPFGLTGEVKIKEAQYCWDGGSVSLTLIDETGAEMAVNYCNDVMWKAEDHGGQFSYRLPNTAKSVYLERNSASERILVEFVRAACVATYGTAEPDKLKKLGGWPRLTMSAFFRDAMSVRDPKRAGQR